MDTESVVNVLPVALLAVAALALIGWLVYRNMRDGKRDIEREEGEKM